MKCVILQPSYIPWRGYFDQIHKADLFVFFDDVQYDDRGWRNRNRIKTPDGPRWLTIPVHSKGCQVRQTPICDIQICQGRPWYLKHWNAIEHCYRKAPFFERYAPMLQDFYRPGWEQLSDLTIELTVALARELGIRHTKFLRSSTLEIAGHKTDRLLNILKTVGASHYISGPSARDYLDEEKFRAAEISLEYMRYDYPEYPQLHSPFDGQVSILDLLFMTGPQAMRFINNTATRADRDEIPASPAVAPSSQHQFAFNEASRETAVSFSGRYAGGGK